MSDDDISINLVGALDDLTPEDRELAEAHLKVMFSLSPAGLSIDEIFQRLLDELAAESDKRREGGRFDLASAYDDMHDQVVARYDELYREQQRRDDDE